MGIIDTQAVTCIGVRGPRGYDAGKGCGVVSVWPWWTRPGTGWRSPWCRPRCRIATPSALDRGKAAWPSLREAVYDGAFTAERCHAWSNLHGMRHHVVERDPATKGFVVVPRRWGVERSFGWLAHWNGVLRDRAGRLDVFAGRLAFVAVLSGVEALINPMPSHETAA